jgi:hypothetical protein
LDPCFAIASLAINLEKSVLELVETKILLSESGPQPGIHFVVEPVPLVDARAPCLVVVQDVPLGVSNLPKGVKRPFLLLWDSTNSEMERAREREERHHL